jgi:colanic acid biosynthesis glycosyl transferase WcaI
MSRVTFLNRFYWPEEPATAQLLADLAETLAADGRAVRVLASHPGGGAADTEVRHGVEIVRARSLRVGGRGKISKALSWAAFFAAALRRVSRDTRPGDTLVLLTDPPLLAALAGPRAQARGARVVHWVQDIYPDLAQALGAGRGLGWLRDPRDRAWRMADAIVSPGEDMAALIRSRGATAERVHTIPNWAPRGLAAAPEAEIAAQRREWGVENRFVVAYSGNLGRVHDLEPILALADALRGEPEFAFVFIGDGAQRPRLEELARARRLANVRFLPPAPRVRLAASLSAADAHLVTLRADCASFVFPSKLAGAAAVGRPVLFLGPPDCEPARLVAGGKFGAAFARDAVAAAAGTLRTWRADPAARAALGRAALDHAGREAGLASAVNRWQGLLATLDGARP